MFFILDKRIICYCFVTSAQKQSLCVVDLKQLNLIIMAIFGSHVEVCFLSNCDFSIRGKYCIDCVDDVKVKYFIYF